MQNKGGSAVQMLSTDDWRSRQPAYQGADGMPMARGDYSLHWSDGQWQMHGRGGIRPVGDNLAAARRQMDEAHASYLSSLPARPVRHVYFIGVAAEIGEAVKIGVSDRPARRLRQLQISSPARLKLLASGPGNEFDETIYHARFNAQHLSGEWFTIDSAILREIVKLRGASHAL